MANSSHHTPFLKHVHLRWGLVGFIALLGAIPRVIHLFYPMQYDEAYTFMAFARPPLYYTLTDYHLPNNHVFHSVLVHFSTRLWGEDPWAIRLPAFLAGWLLIPAVYLLAETLYNSRVALIAAILVAGWPNLINYSANARGYSLIMLLTLGLFYLGTRVLHEDRLGLWLGMSLLAAIGLFTVPVMAYPLAMLGIWMVMEAVRGVLPTRLSPRYAVTAFCAYISNNCFAYLLVLYPHLGRFGKPSPVCQFVCKALSVDRILAEGANLATVFSR
jgi:4-amino-4-deoxy-L-arabinose transferase-like glycosyltransferase